MFGRKTKELEAKIKGKDMVIISLRRINKEIKAENKRTVQFTEKVIEVINNKGTIVDKYDKIKALVADYQSNN